MARLSAALLLAALCLLLAGAQAAAASAAHHSARHPAKLASEEPSVAALQVHIVCHSHDDSGWLKTMDQSVCPSTWPSVSCLLFCWLLAAASLQGCSLCVWQCLPARLGCQPACLLPGWEGGWQRLLTGLPLPLVCCRYYWGANNTIQASRAELRRGCRRVPLTFKTCAADVVPPCGGPGLLCRPLLTAPSPNMCCIVLPCSRLGCSTFWIPWSRRWPPTPTANLWGLRWCGGSPLERWKLVVATGGWGR